MTAGLLAALAGLSLLDSTSFGTLLIPLWLLLTAGRVRVDRIGAYLGTVAVFYFVVGVALAVGADVALRAFQDTLGSIPQTPLRAAQLAVGVGLVVLSYWLEARVKRRGETPGRLQTWRTQAVTDTGGSGGAASLMKLAVIATSIEVATMLPYLVAIGLLTAADLNPATFGVTLAAYCVVMILPAIVLTTVRIIWHDKVDPLLVRINDWFTRNNAKAVGWTVGGIGVGVAFNALVNLMFVQS